MSKLENDRKRQMKEKLSKIVINEFFYAVCAKKATGITL